MWEAFVWHSFFRQSFAWHRLIPVGSVSLGFIGPSCIWHGSVWQPFPSLSLVWQSFVGPDFDFDSFCIVDLYLAQLFLVQLCVATLCSAQLCLATLWLAAFDVDCVGLVELYLV